MVNKLNSVASTIKKNSTYHIKTPPLALPVNIQLRKQFSAAQIQLYPLKSRTYGTTV